MSEVLALEGMPDAEEEGYTDYAVEMRDEQLRDRDEVVASAIGVLRLSVHEVLVTARAGTVGALILAPQQELDRVPADRDVGAGAAGVLRAVASIGAALHNRARCKRRTGKWRRES